MRPEDDPEQRIRELERSLSDIARTSELGSAEQASAYPAQMPAPMPSSQNPYGANPFPTYESYHAGPDYQSPGPTRAIGLRLGWIVFAFLVVGLAAGGVFIGINNTSSPGRPVTPSADPTGPSMHGGGGPFVTETIPVQPPMTVEPPTSLDPPQTGSSISVAGVGTAKTVECNNSTVSVSGVDNMVTITGHCARVEVSGVENNVSIESTDSINASGMNNRVRYLSGDPNIDQSGFDNVVERG